jgi:hypothetical protein
MIINMYISFYVTIITLIIIPGRRKEQRVSDSTEQNGNHTKQTQRGPSQSPPNIGVGQENGNKLNKRIRWSQQEMKEELWCFTYVKEKALGDNYVEAYKLWREKNPMTRTNIRGCKSTVKPEERLKN